jgi:hypothetical protein
VTNARKRAAGRVEIWRGGCRCNHNLLTGPFGCRCLTNRPCLRFQIPLIKPNVQLARIRLPDKVADAVAHPGHPQGMRWFA